MKKFLRKIKFFIPVLGLVLVLAGASHVEARAMRTGDACYKTITDPATHTSTTYTGSWVSYDGGTGSDGVCDFTCGAAVKGGTVGVSSSLSLDGTYGGTKLFQAFYRIFPKSAPAPVSR